MDGLAFYSHLTLSVLKLPCVCNTGAISNVDLNAFVFFILGGFLTHLLSHCTFVLSKDQLDLYGWAVLRRSCMNSCVASSFWVLPPGSVSVWVCLGTGEITEEELLTRLQQAKDDGQRAANGASSSPSPSPSPSPSASANGTSVRRPEATGK